jgi:hypothetical protein
MAPRNLTPFYPIPSRLPVNLSSMTPDSAISPCTTPTGRGRFVFLSHDYPAPHCDILLEEGARLLSWSAKPGCHCRTGEAVVQRPDHRLFYLDYEGPVSDNRGHVARIDGGYLTWIVCTPDYICVDLLGEHHRGKFSLTRTDGLQWSVAWEPYI